MHETHCVNTTIVAQHVESQQGMILNQPIS